MPPRYAYWTILIDQKPTAFRAREREELLPTFHQLRRKNTDVAMKWFARGRLWESPEAAQAAQRAPKPPLEKRGRDWRPGGEHRDPRDRFKKRSRPQGDLAEPKRDGDKPAGRPRSRPWARKPPSGPPRGARPWGAKPPSGPPPSGPPPSVRPWGATPPSGPSRSSRPWDDKPKGGPPRGARPWSGKPSSQRRDNDRRDRPQGSSPRKPWSSAPETETRKRTPETPSTPPASEPRGGKPKPSGQG